MRQSRKRDLESGLYAWVTCLDCYNEYFREDVEEGCPICESKEYEEIESEKGYLEIEDLEDIL